MSARWIQCRGVTPAVTEMVEVVAGSGRLRTEVEVRPAKPCRREATYVHYQSGDVPYCGSCAPLIGTLRAVQPNDVARWGRD